MHEMVTKLPASTTADLSLFHSHITKTQNSKFNYRLCFHYFNRFFWYWVHFLQLISSCVTWDFQMPNIYRIVGQIFRLDERLKINLLHKQIINGIRVFVLCSMNIKMFHKLQFRCLVSLVMVMLSGVSNAWLTHEVCSCHLSYFLVKENEKSEEKRKQRLVHLRRYNFHLIKSCYQLGRLPSPMWINTFSHNFINSLMCSLGKFTSFTVLWMSFCSFRDSPFKSPLNRSTIGMDFCVEIVLAFVTHCNWRRWFCTVNLIVSSKISTI